MSTGIAQISQAVALAGQVHAAEKGSPEQLLTALQTQLPGKQFSFLYVSSADSFIPNKMVVAMLKSGTVASSAKSIIDILSVGGKPLAVGSKNEQVAAATLARALAELNSENLFIRPQPTLLVRRKAGLAQLLQRFAILA